MWFTPPVPSGRENPGLKNGRRIRFTGLLEGLPGLTFRKILVISG